MLTAVIKKEEKKMWRRWKSREKEGVSRRSWADLPRDLSLSPSLCSFYESLLLNCLRERLSILLPRQLVDSQHLKSGSVTCKRGGKALAETVIRVTVVDR